MKLIGNIQIQPNPSLISASKQITRVVFSSNDSGSYIHGGTNPYTGTGPKTGSITFENDGHLYTFVFSGSAFTSPSGYPGTTISASINGLTNSGSIAGAFTSSVLLNTAMTASIISENIVELTTSVFSTSSYVTSSFPNTVLRAFDYQIGTPEYYISSSDTTGSLEVTGSVKITGSLEIDGLFVIPSGSVPSGSGLPGQTIIASKGTDHFIFVYAGGSWKSSSLM